MAKLVVVQAQGFTKEEALSTTVLAGSVLKFDASASWKNEDSPSVDSKYLDAFAEDYLRRRKIDGIVGVAASVTVESGTADSRERPYKVDNVVTDGARKWKTVYQGFVGANDLGLGGVLVLQKDTKAEAEQAAKDYVTENKVNVKVVVAKEVTKGQAVAMEVKYTPSVNTRKGTYIFFGTIA